MEARAKNTITAQDIQTALASDSQAMKGLIATFLQGILQARFDTHIGADAYERSEKRIGYRNGHYQRDLSLRVGTIRLSVPRDREGTFQPELFERFQRSEKALILSMAEMYLSGVSTRKVNRIAVTLCGKEISKSQVSELAKELDGAIIEWRKRPLEEDYAYLVVDATYVKTRIGDRVVALALMMAIGVRLDGKREILAVEVSDKEAEYSWLWFFAMLKDRGLKGIKYLVVSDQHRGLVKAIEKAFVGVCWQRCQVHFMRNFLNRFSHKNGELWVRRLKDVFSAPSKKEALERVHRLADDLRSSGKKDIAEWLEEGIEDCLAVYNVPEAHHKRVRTTNAIERLNLEVKQRTRVMRIVGSPEALLRIAGDICMQQSDDWVAKTYLAM